MGCRYTHVSIHARTPTLFLSTMPFPLSCMRSFSMSHLVMSPFQYSTVAAFSSPSQISEKAVVWFVVGWVGFM